MTTPGRQLATGRTADLFAFGNDSVVKILRPSFPAEWASIEFDLARRIHVLDVATPEPRALIEIDGRAAVVFERIDGTSMQTSVLTGDLAVAEAADLLADIHRRILACPPPSGLPAVSDRIAAKIDSVGMISRAEQQEGRLLVEGLPTGDRLLHGDLHPNNVILNESGPVVIDWFDASIGHPAADIARSKLLMRSPDTELERDLAAKQGITRAAAPHLPGATVEVLDAFRSRYLEAMSGVLDEYEVDDITWRNWLAVNALGRVAEQAQPDDGPLLAIWRSRPEPTSRPDHTSHPETPDQLTGDRRR